MNPTTTQEGTMLRNYVLRGDVIVRDSAGREATVTPEHWAGDEQWIPALDSMCQPRFVNRSDVTEAGRL